MGAPLSIRIATDRDVSEIVALYADDILGRHREAMVSDISAYQAGYERVAASPNTNVYVAERDGAIIGTFQLTFTPGIAQLGVIRATIEAVRTRADLRGQGIGAAMMAYCIDEARRQGAGFLQLTSNNERPDAHRFYVRLGFKPSHTGFKYELRAGKS